jgi:uncharacterized membrane-anchored protein YhcB (DUF1043 family)
VSVTVVAVVAALVAGVVAGFAAGRFGGRAVPEADRALRQRELDDAAGRVAALERSLELAEAMREQGRVEARHLRTSLERVRDERTLLAARDERSRAEVADLTRQRDLLLREVVGLQRRVAELRVARARGVDDEDATVAAGGPGGPRSDAVVDLRDGVRPEPEVVVDLRDGVVGGSGAPAPAPLTGAERPA